MYNEYNKDLVTKVGIKNKPKINFMMSLEGFYKILETMSKIIIATI